MEFRILKTALHETLHLIGLDHCIYMECIMNGTNLIEEADKKPFALCPICIRKVIYFDKDFD